MDSALKQRLLGAAVLIALAIIFVPMFLGNSPPKEASTIQNLDIPPLPDRKFETRTLPVDAAAPASPAAVPAAPAPGGDNQVVTVDTKAPSTFEGPDANPAGTSEPAAAAVTGNSKQAPPKPAPPAAEQKSTPTAVKSPEREAAPAKPVPAAADAGRFAVNLGVYVASGHAEALVARLRKAGFSAYIGSAEYQGKAAQAVRVGPFADRAAAEAARLKIKQREPKLPSSVIESADTTSADAPATALAANRAGGWAVQLGAFKAEADANKLRDRVRGVGVAAFVDRTGSGDQLLWRVRAGPFAERSSAESTRATLKAKLQTEGMIVTQP
jgi:DedD protein